ncbi:TatD family hydrolase [Candidatus Woesearchaeota archaeon]|nr:TatD family hydrolase [Candidatus Woesearchaeota archaeon]
MLIDVHCHLDHITHDTVDNVLRRAHAAGVGIIINNGTNPTTNRTCLELAKKYPFVKAALGFYPTDTLKMSPEEIDAEMSFIKKNKDIVIALGEVGIDYHWVTDAVQQKTERENFERVMDFAEKIKKPLIVHSRKAEADVIDLLASSPLKKVVFHCFGGGMKLVPKIVDAGWMFSIPTNIVRDIHFQKLVAMVPVSQLLTETDAPFLGPEKEKPNEPATIAKALPVMAKLHRVTMTEMENLLFMNYQRVFL